MGVASALHFIFIQESSQILLQVISRGLDVPGVPVLADGNGQVSFPSARKKVVKENLLSFWMSHVSKAWPAHFVGRYFHFAETERLARLTSVWVPDDLEEF